MNTKELSSLPRAVIVFVVLPAALYFGLDFVVSSLLLSMSSDGQLLCFQAVLALIVFAGMLSTGLMRDLGWRGPKGWSYLWVLGPLWLGIVTPVAAAISFYLNEPQTVLTYFVISALVAFNEETIFRGFVLQGLQTHLSPLAATLLMSLAFGGLHVMNISAGGDPVFVGAQMLIAAGTGTVLAAITLRSNSLLPAFAYHLLADWIGLGALGGYDAAIVSAEMAPAMIISGLLFAAWGLFWVWRFQRNQNLPARFERECGATNNDADVNPEVNLGEAT